MATRGERFSEAVFDYLVKYNLRNSLGKPSLGKINGKILGELYDRFDQGESRKNKAEQSKRMSKAERNVLFETLAKATGCDRTSMTEAEEARCGVAVSAIVRATPDVTPGELDEACRRYVAKMPGATITPTAVSNNWSKLFDSKNRGSTRLAKPEPVMEPNDWRGLLRDDPEEESAINREWSAIQPFYQGRIARKCERLRKT